MSFNLTPIGHIRARLNLVHFKGAWELHMGQGATGCRPLTHGTMFINIQKLFSVISITAVILDGHLSFIKLIFRPKHWLWFSTQSSFTWHHFCHKDMNLEVHDQSACACQHMSFCGFHFEKSALFRLWARLQIKDNLWPKKKRPRQKANAAELIVCAAFHLPPVLGYKRASFCWEMIQAGGESQQAVERGKMLDLGTAHKGKYMSLHTCTRYMGTETNCVHVSACMWCVMPWFQLGSTKTSLLITASKVGHVARVEVLQKMVWLQNFTSVRAHTSFSKYRGIKTWM